MKHKSFQTQEDPFAKTALGISKNYPEVFLLVKFLQTKPQVKNMNIIFMIYIILLLKIEKKKIMKKSEKNCK